MPSYPSNPDYAASPGQVLKVHLDTHDLSVAEFAQRCGRPVEFIGGIISGMTSLDRETALLFEKEFALDADTWLAVEANYRQKLIHDEEKRARGNGAARFFRFLRRIMSRANHGLKRNHPGVTRQS